MTLSGDGVTVRLQMLQALTPFTGPVVASFYLHRIASSRHRFETDNAVKSSTSFLSWTKSYHTLPFTMAKKSWILELTSSSVSISVARGLRSAPLVAKSPASFIVLHINLWFSCVISAFPHSEAEEMPGNSQSIPAMNSFFLEESTSSNFQFFEVSTCVSFIFEIHKALGTK